MSTFPRRNRLQGIGLSTRLSTAQNDSKESVSQPGFPRRNRLQRIGYSTSLHPSRTIQIKWLVNACYLTSSQPRRSYQDKTQTIKSQVKVQWSTVDVIRHSKWEVDGGKWICMSLDSENQKAQFLAVGEACEATFQPAPDLSEGILDGSRSPTEGTLSAYGARHKS